MNNKTRAYISLMVTAGFGYLSYQNSVAELIAFMVVFFVLFFVFLLVVKYGLIVAKYGIKLIVKILSPIINFLGWISMVWVFFYIFTKSQDSK